MTAFLWVLAVPGLLATAWFLVEVAPDLPRWLRRRRRERLGLDADYRSGGDEYAGLDWPSRLFSETWRASRGMTWWPYQYWRCPPFQGAMVNIDTKGRRRVILPDPVLERPLVFCHGGSAMWGLGARDGGTIPSMLAAALAAAGKPARLECLAEIGHVSTQGGLALLDALRAGERPDLVVFMDGVNDMVAAYQSGRPGQPQNEYNRVREFNVLNRETPWRFRQAAPRQMLRRTMRVLDGLRGRRHSEKTVYRGHTEDLTAGDLPARVADAYADVVAMVDEMGQRYGFTALFFWQPLVWGKPVRTAYETHEADRNDRFRPFFEACRAAVLAHPRLAGRVIDLTPVFEGMTEGVFLDFTHLSERGNARVAGAMAPHVLAADRLVRGTASG